MKAKITFILLAVTTLLLAGLYMYSGGQSAVIAQTDSQTADDEPERIIHVTGYGAVTARPDMAIVHLGVETEADSAAAALEENNLRMSSLISVTLEAGVAEEDIRTDGLRLQAIYDNQGNDNASPQVVGYRASNIAAVTVRDLDSLGALLDAAVEAGGNAIQNISFEVTDREELMAAAREAAMNNATAKAEQLTGLANAELGEVLTITEAGGTPPVPVLLETAQTADSAVPIAPGTQEIQAIVQVSWRIQGE
jgi:uncharacterized protein YggE